MKLNENKTCVSNLLHTRVYCQRNMLKNTSLVQKIRQNHENFKFVHCTVQKSR